MAIKHLETTETAHRAHIPASEIEKILRKHIKTAPAGADVTFHYSCGMLDEATVEWKDRSPAKEIIEGEDPE
jgi:hypothetical protein